MSEKSTAVSVRLDAASHKRFIDALIREQSKYNKRMYASTIILPCIMEFIERSESEQ
jgi:hypothetical protein